MSAGEIRDLLDQLARVPVSKREPTFLEIAGYPHYENVSSNLLAFFLDPGKPHGLGTLLLRCLMRKIDSSFDDVPSEHIDVRREVQTNRGNRIDILVRSDTLSVLIENKIFASRNNPFEDYSNFLSQVSVGGYNVLLTLRPVGARLHGGFFNITHGQWMLEIRKGLADSSLQPDPRYLTLLREYLATMEALEVGTTMDSATFRLLADRKNDVERLLKEVDTLRNELRAKTEAVACEMSVKDIENLKRGFWSHPIEIYDCLVHDFQGDDRPSVAIDAVLSPGGWHFEVFSRQKKHSETIRRVLKQVGQSCTLDDRSRCVLTDKFAYDTAPKQVAEFLDLLIPRIAEVRNPLS